MKSIYILFVSVLLSTASQAQSQYKFKIDGRDYSIKEGKLNDFFGIAFNELVKRGDAKESSYELWVKSFENWKMTHSNGTASWDIYYDRIVNSTLSGETTPEDRGVDKKGNPAKGKANKYENHAQRIALINFFMHKYLTYEFTGREVLKLK